MPTINIRDTKSIEMNNIGGDISATLEKGSDKVELNILNQGDVESYSISLDVDEAEELSKWLKMAVEEMRK